MLQATLVVMCAPEKGSNLFKTITDIMYLVFYFL